MTREEAIQHFKEQLDIFGGEHAEAIKVAIEALKLTFENDTEIKSCSKDSDLISRAEAVKRLLLYKQSKAKIVSRYDMGFVDGLSHAINILDLVPLVYIPSINIKDLAPSADRPRGRWHYSDGKPATIGQSFGVICDQCGAESEYCTNFCGECGADMRGDTE